MLQIGYTLYILITKIKLTINKSLELRKELRNTTSRCGGLELSRETSGRLFARRRWVRFLRTWLKYLEDSGRPPGSR